MKRLAAVSALALAVISCAGSGDESQPGTERLSVDYGDATAESVRMPNGDITATLTSADGDQLLATLEYHAANKKWSVSMGTSDVQPQTLDFALPDASVEGAADSVFDFWRVSKGEDANSCDDCRIYPSDGTWCPAYLWTDGHYWYCSSCACYY